MTLIDRACYERGCACYDSRVDRDGVEVVQRKWVGLTDEDWKQLYDEFAMGQELDEFARAIEAKLREKNT